MNRQQRRRARSARRHNRFYQRYVRHLPRLPLDAPLERGRVYHIVVAHDHWCAFYRGGACNCNPIISRHLASRRS